MCPHLSISDGVRKVWCWGHAPPGLPDCPGLLVVLAQPDHRHQVQHQAAHQQHQHWDVEVNHLLRSFILEIINYCLSSKPPVIQQPLTSRKQEVCPMLGLMGESTGSRISSNNMTIVNTRDVPIKVIEDAVIVSISMPLTPGGGWVEDEGFCSPARDILSWILG